MPNRKLRLFAQSEVIPQPHEPGPNLHDWLDRESSMASAKENVRLLKAFSRIDDDRQRAWLLELVEHFAGLDAPTH